MSKPVSINDVTITYDDRWAHVMTDDTLLSFLARPENGSLALAKRIHEEYQAKFHKPLDISQNSIAVEVVVHAYVGVLSQRTEQLGKKLPKGLSGQLIKLMKECQRHTDSIDIGELSVDNNRNVFDSLSQRLPRGILFSILGDLA